MTLDVAFMAGAGGAVAASAGLFLGAALRKAAPRVLPPFAFGVALLLFVDLFAESADLGRGTEDAATIVTLLAAFLTGGALFAAVSGRAGDAALAWAFGLGLHGLGEGLVVAIDAASGHAAFTPTQTASYLLHKLFEGASVAALLAAGEPPRVGRLATFVALIALPVSLGALLPLAGIGGGAGLLIFALGAGANLLAILGLGARAGVSDRRGPVAAAALIGAASIYLAGLLHEH